MFIVVECCSSQSRIALAMIESPKDQTPVSHIRIAKPAAERLKAELFNVPPDRDLIACRSMDASVRHARHPLAQLRIPSLPSHTVFMRS